MCPCSMLQRLVEPPLLILSPSDLRPEVAACSFGIPKPNVMVSLGRLWPRDAPACILTKL